MKGRCSSEQSAPVHQCAAFPDMHPCMHLHSDTDSAGWLLSALHTHRTPYGLHCLHGIGTLANARPTLTASRGTVCSRLPRKSKLYSRGAAGQSIDLSLQHALVDACSRYTWRSLVSAPHHPAKAQCTLGAGW